MQPGRLLIWGLDEQVVGVIPLAVAYIQRYLQELLAHPLSSLATTDKCPRNIEYMLQVAALNG